MRTIYKYNIPITKDSFTVDMPAGARVLDVGVQYAAGVFWAEVDDTRPQVTREFRLFVTGGPLAMNLEYDPSNNCTHAYVGTFQIPMLPQGELFVGHLYEALPVPVAIAHAQARKSEEEVILGIDKA